MFVLFIVLCVCVCVCVCVWEELICKNIRMGKKGDLSDFERGMLLVPDGLDWVFQKLLIFWDYHTQPSLGFTENALEKQKISSERQLCGRKCLVDVRGQRRMGRLVRDDRKATITQITTRYNQDMQNTIFWMHNTSNPEADGLQQQNTTPGAAPVREQETEARVTKIGQKKIGKTLHGQMSLDFCCDIQMVGSEYAVKNMKAWIHPSLSQWFRLVVVV